MGEIDRRMDRVWVRLSKLPGSSSHRTDPPLAIARSVSLDYAARDAWFVVELATVRQRYAILER